MNARFLPLLALAASAVAAPPEPKFRALTIDPGVQIGYGVAVADVDGDGKPDILLADKKQFVWYRNPGAEKAAQPAAWSKFVLAENLTVKDNVCIAAQDIDDDGKCEIAVGAEWNPGDTVNSGAVFYLIAPADRTQRWEAVKFPNVEPTTHRMKWIKLDKHNVEWGLIVVPLHGRGNKNGEGAPVKVLCYRKPADVRSEWPAEVVDESLHMTHNFDIETPQTNAGSPQLVIGGHEGVNVSVRIREIKQWRGGAVDLLAMEKSPLAGVGEIRRGTNMFAMIQPMHGSTLAAYVADSHGKQQSTWTRHVLTDQLTDGHALACGDVLGTGSDQIVVGWRGNPQKPRPVGIKLYTPLDDKGEQWRDSFIDDNEMACEDLVLADLNADGRLDVVASGRSTHNLKIYLNETPR